MEGMKYMFDAVLMVLKHDFTVFGFTMCFLDIFLFSIIAGFIGVGISKLFGGE